MDAETQQGAEALIRQLCMGAEVYGVSFDGGIPKLLLRHRVRSAGKPEEAYINVASRWAILPSSPDHIPTREDELVELSLDEEAKILGAFEGRVIADIRLDDAIPHLLVTFGSGEVFLVHGHKERYEPWDLGSRSDSRQVFALPGDEIGWVDGPAEPA